MFFHNGEELKADDVVFTVDRGKQSAYLGAIWAPVDHAEVIDDYTVKVVLKYPMQHLVRHGWTRGAAITIARLSRMLEKHMVSMVLELVHIRWWNG